MSDDFHYVGTELELFSSATNWKQYLRRQVAPYLGRQVLEVGAGLGGTTRLLCGPGQRSWVCLEPDSTLARSLGEKRDRGELPAFCEVVVGTLADIPADSTFDSLLYIDVLEHIEDDRGELERAAAHVSEGGHLVVLSPAHPWLFSPFDEAIGHFRRYTRTSLAALTPRPLVPTRCVYLDSVGLLASLGNRLLLRHSMPGARQIAFWDRVLVPGSRLVDPLVRYSLGKSVLCVWRRPSADGTVQDRGGEGLGRMPAGVGRSPGDRPEGREAT